MVVRFTDAGNAGAGDSRSRNAGLRGRTPRAKDNEPVGSEHPETDERLAPVTYLPGAKPTEKAERARARVEQVGRTADTAEERRGKRPGARAANVSLHQLARRGMSRWELQQVLQRREVDERTAEAELDRLERVGLLDDAALAVTLVYTQHTRKGLGRTAIAHELRRRHIDQDIIDDALSEIEDGDERERALELAHKRAGQLRGFDDETARRRLSGFLARKGYSNEIVREAVDSALGSRGA
ncbi:MAG TPA: regulatory protein RecX [Microbacteriaceae bacterium]|jgi:regulatory protein|nr:regulatory protein RecX [Microbacteriaceae bacterium]